MSGIKCEKVPKILFIKGIFIKDCLSDDIFEKKILEHTNPQSDYNIDNNDLETPIDINFINYEKFPTTFESIETWKKKTNIKCWCCTLSFDTIPIFIPNVIEPITPKNKIERENMLKQQFSISVYGTFCSFGCAYFFIESHNFSIAEKIESLNKLKLLHKLMYNKKIKDIGYYPSPYRLEQYGGNLTIAEFKSMQELYKLENSDVEIMV